MEYWSVSFLTTLPKGKSWINQSLGYLLALCKVRCPTQESWMHLTLALNNRGLPQIQMYFSVYWPLPPSAIKHRCCHPSYNKLGKAIFTTSTTVWAIGGPNHKCMSSLDGCGNIRTSNIFSNWDDYMQFLFKEVHSMSLEYVQLMSFWIFVFFTYWYGSEALSMLLPVYSLIRKKQPTLKMFKASHIHDSEISHYENGNSCLTNHEQSLPRMESLKRSKAILMIS